MHLGSLFSLLTLICVKANKDYDILKLNDANFQQTLETFDTIVVKFHAPWCKYCQKLAPEYAEAAKILKIYSKVKLAELDTSLYPTISDTYNISQLPTVRLFRSKASSLDFAGKLEHDALVNWIDRSTGSVTIDIADTDELQKFRKTHSIFILGIFSSLDSPSSILFNDLANEDTQHLYCITMSTEIMKYLEIEKDSIVLFKNYDEPRINLNITETTTLAELKSSILIYSHPLLHLVTVEDYHTFFSPTVKVQILVFLEWNYDMEHARNNLAKLAVEFRDSIQFHVVPGSEWQILDYYLIKRDTLPAFMALDNRVPKRFKKHLSTHVQYSLENVAQYVHDFLDGKLPLYLRSQAVDKYDQTGIVTRIRGSNFNNLVLGHKSAALVLFLFPGRENLPVLNNWRRLASYMKNQRNALLRNMFIGYLDVSENDIDLPSLHLGDHEIPLVVLFSGENNAEVEVFEGEHKIENYVEFLAEYLSQESSSSTPTSVQDMKYTFFHELQYLLSYKTVSFAIREYYMEWRNFFTSKRKHWFQPVGIAGAYFIVIGIIGFLVTKWKYDTLDREREKKLHEYLERKKKEEKEKKSD